MHMSWTCHVNGIIEYVSFVTRFFYLAHQKSVIKYPESTTQVIRNKLLLLLYVYKNIVICIIFLVCKYKSKSILRLLSVYENATVGSREKYMEESEKHVQNHFTACVFLGN